MNFDSPHAASQPVAFRNVSDQSAPAFAVMAVTGVEMEHGIAMLLCDRPSATFCREYVVNHQFDVPAGRRGSCFRSGTLRALFESGEPQPLEGWGPKPGSWALALGHPGFSVHGTVHAGHRIARVAFEPIEQLLVRTTSPVAPNSSTTAYQIFGGTFGSEANLGFTTVPSARNRTGQTLAANEFAWAVWTNNGWELRVLANRCYHVTIGSPGIGAGATGSVTLPSPDGRTVTAVNWSSDTPLASGDKCLCWQDFTDSVFYLIKSGGGGAIWHSTAFDDIAPGDTGTVFLSDESEVEATNWSDDAPIAANDKIHVYRDPVDDEYYAIKSGGGIRWFKGELTAKLDNTDPTASVNTLAALDGGDHPGEITADNYYGLAGTYPSPVLVTEDLSGTEGSSGYILVQVRHVELDADEDVLMDGLDLKQKKRKHVVMTSKDQATTTVDEGVECDE